MQGENLTKQFPNLLQTSPQDSPTYQGKDSQVSENVINAQNVKHSVYEENLQA